MNETIDEVIVDGNFVYDLQTQAPNRRFWKIVSAFLGFWILVYVLWKTGLILVGLRHSWNLVRLIISRLFRYLFDRYFDLKRLAEWLLMCVSPQLYFFWITCRRTYVVVNAIWTKFIYILDRFWSLLSIFGINRKTKEQELARQTSVDSLKRAPLTREISNVNRRLGKI